MFAKRLMLLSVMVMLTSACESKVAFGTDTRTAWCEALLEAAPSASATQDSAQTREEVADIGDTIDTLCEDYRP